MEIRYLSSFKRMYRKLPEILQTQVDATLSLFEVDPFDLRLYNHKLSGSKRGIRSISAGYDLRILYVEENGHRIILLLAVGKHDDVY